MMFVKGGNVVLIARALQRGLLIRESGKNSARRERRLRKNDPCDVQNLLKKNLRGDAEDQVQALNNLKLQLGEETLVREKDNGEYNREKTLFPKKAIGVGADESGVLLLRRKATVGAVLPEKREGSDNIGLLHLMIGTAWRINEEVANRNSLTLPLKKPEE